LIFPEMALRQTIYALGGQWEYANSFALLYAVNIYKLYIFLRKELDNNIKGEQARGVGEGRLACSSIVV
jgi:hypothetical protein